MKYNIKRIHHYLDCLHNKAWSSILIGSLFWIIYLGLNSCTVIETVVPSPTPQLIDNRFNGTFRYNGYEEQIFYFNGTNQITEYHSWYCDWNYNARMLLTLSITGTELTMYETDCMGNTYDLREKCQFSFNSDNSILTLYPNSIYLTKREFYKVLPP